MEKIEIKKSYLAESKYNSLCKMFKPNLSEPKKYIWKFPVLTNRNRFKELIIVNTLIDINNRCDMMASFLNISRYGIPCYVFPDDSDTDPARLTHSNDKTIYDKEYCYVGSNIKDKIYLITPIEYIPKPPEFNINAPEFIPKFAQVNVHPPITKNTIKPPRAPSMPPHTPQPPQPPQHPYQLQTDMHQAKLSNPSKLNIKQMLNVTDTRNVPVARSAPIFVPDIYQSGTVQFNMKYF
jgi:hypothetical protein